MQEETAKTLLATLRRIGPAKVRAYTSDDEFRDIAVPTRRKRWTQVLDTLDKLAWSKLELLDSKGALLGQIDNSEPAHELQDLGGGEDKLAPQYSLALRINELMLRSQEKVLSFRDKETTTLLQAQGEVLREMAAGMHTLAGLYREQVKVARENAEVSAATQAAASSSSELQQLLEAAPAILQLLPVLKTMLGSGAPSADVPSNGAPKKH
jgi:hypothetical protein